MEGRNKELERDTIGNSIMKKIYKISFEFSADNIYLQKLIDVIGSALKVVEKMMRIKVEKFMVEIKEKK